MPDHKLPRRQAECLRAIRRYWRANQISPTRSELGRELGITRVSAHLLVAKLEASGHVATIPGGWRNIVLKRGDGNG